MISNHVYWLAGKFVAACSSSGAVHVIASDFSRHISELAIHSARAARQLIWCGTDSLVYANSEVLNEATLMQNLCLAGSCWTDVC